MKKAENKYFQVYDNYFWQWEEQNTVLAIPNGNTIAYRKSIVETMEILSVQGLPPFGSLLLVIIATSQRGDESLDMIKRNINDSQRQSHGDLNHEIIKGAFDFLEQLSRLPAEYKVKEKLILLLQSVFKDCHNKKSLNVSKVLVSQIKMQRITSDSYTKKAIDPTIFNIDFRPLALLRNKFKSNEELIDVIRAIPEEIELELDTDTEGDLISDLIAEPKTFHIGSLVEKLWGGLNIPMHYTNTSQQQLGGVSDISNKGDFDKLFLSEFANEEEVFLSRLANNEALYIKREAPPQNDNFNRFILIDISLRNWGTPKIIGCAIMLALAKLSKSKMNYKIYLIGNHSYEVNYHSTNDIINIVDYIDPCLYPSNGFLDFFRNHPTDDSEVILLSNTATMKYPEMKALVDEYRRSINYIIYSESNGEIDIYRILKNSSKLIQSLKLDLEERWRKAPKRSSNKIIDVESSAAHPSRLLFTPRPGFQLMQLGDHYYVIDKSLLLKKVSKDKGWKIVFDKIDKALSAYQLAYNDDKEPLLLLCYDNQKKIRLHNLATNTEISESIKKNLGLQSAKIYFYQGAFYAWQVNSFNSIPKEVKNGIRISIDLKVETFEDATLIKEIESVQAETIRNYNKERRLNYEFSSLIRLKRVALTQDNLLVLNQKHVLTITNSKLRLTPYSSNNKEFKEEAYFYKDRGDEFFKFRNGVVIKSFYGILNITLKGNKEVQIPLAIGPDLAMAVDEEVSGNDYFYVNKLQHTSRGEIESKMLELLTNDDTWN